MNFVFVTHMTQHRCTLMIGRPLNSKFKFKSGWKWRKMADPGMFYDFPSAKWRQTEPKRNAEP